LPSATQGDELGAKAAEVLIGYVQNRLVHEGVQMDVLRRHKLDALDGDSVGKLRREVGAVALEKRWRLTDGDANQPGRVVDLGGHQLLSLQAGTCARAGPLADHCADGGTSGFAQELHGFDHVCDAVI
jgi:hypothetical protein